MLPLPVDASSLPPPRQALLDARAELSRLLNGRFSTEPLERLSYARDMWPLALLWIRQGRIPPPPDAIAWPGTEQELVELVRLARAWFRKRYDVSFRMSRLVESGTFAHTMEVAATWENVHEVYERVHHATSKYVSCGDWADPRRIPRRSMRGASREFVDRLKPMCTRVEAFSSDAAPIPVPENS